MATQKLYKYDEGDKQTYCYANNEGHAMQVLRDKLNKKVDKTKIVEYAEAKDAKDNKKKKYPKKKKEETTSKKK